MLAIFISLAIVCVIVTGSLLFSRFKTDKFEITLLNYLCKMREQHPKGVHKNTIVEYLQLKNLIQFREACFKLVALELINVTNEKYRITPFGFKYMKLLNEGKLKKAF